MYFHRLDYTGNESEARERASYRKNEGRNELGKRREDLYWVLVVGQSGVKTGRTSRREMGRDCIYHGNGALLPVAAL